MNQKFRRSALFGPFTLNQIINRTKWALLIALPPIAYYRWRYIQTHRVEAPLIQAMRMQPVDFDGVKNWWDQWNKTIQPFRTDKEKQKSLSFEDWSEIEFLKSFSWDAKKIQ